MDCGLGLCKSTGGDIKGQHETHKTTRFWDSVLEDYTSARNRFGILTWRKTFQFHKQLLRVLSMLLHAFPSCGLPHSPADVLKPQNFNEMDVSITFVCRVLLNFACGFVMFCTELCV